MKVSSPSLHPDLPSLWPWHVPVLRQHLRQDSNPPICLFFFLIFPNFPFYFFFPPSGGCGVLGGKQGKAERCRSTALVPGEQHPHRHQHPAGSLTIDLIGNHHLGRGLAGTPQGLGTPGTLLGRAVPETRP